MNKWLFICMLLGVACATQNQRAPRRTTFKKAAAEKLDARLKVFYPTHDTARVYFVLTTRPQDYYYLSDKSRYKAEYNLTYELFEFLGGSKQKIDTASLRLVDMQQKPVGQTLTAYFECKLPQSTAYALKINMVNVNNDAEYNNYLKFTNTSCTSAENFLVLDTKNQPLLERNFKHENGYLHFSSSCNEVVRLYRISGKMDYPKPPFSDDNFAAQNNYDKVPVTLTPEGNHAFGFTNLEKGLYTVETNENTGVVFYHFNSWYPISNDTANFYEPLLYISSKAEYEQFLTSENTKTQFEKFWLDRAGNKTAARKAINEYYKRVFEANSEYTAVQEGWKTDRGMVSIVFGKPTYTEKQLNKEIWTYNTTFNTRLTFVFYKIDNVFSDNDYRLERDFAYKVQWYNAVENWRNGRPFNLTGTY